MRGDFLINQAKDRIYAKRGGTPKMAGIIQDLCDDNPINMNYKDETAGTMLAGLIKKNMLALLVVDQRNSLGIMNAGKIWRVQFITLS
jgi:hypothetical protein